VRRAHAPLVRTELYGDDEPALDDPAELFHESSKLYPALAQRQSAGLARLAGNEELQTLAAHATRRNPHLPRVDLPPALRPECSLWCALDLRRSRRDFAPRAIGVRQLATLLDAACGFRDGRRTIPSGGALYPLEVFVVAHRVAGLRCGVLRYDAELHALERHASGDAWRAFLDASPVPDLVDRAAAALLVLAVFGRTRFKYGLRGYRFALLEAGHLAQNAVLAAAALGIAALPFGGYYDARLDELVGADGVEESIAYAVVVGAA
jgi:SagB-type dehydrogenase family enzyme